MKRWAVVGVAVVLTGCGGPPPPPLAPTPTPATTWSVGVARFWEQDIAWEPCGEHECAEVAAPLDWQQPEGPRITLALLKVSAREQPVRGTVFVNPGGPGASGKDLAARVNTIGFPDYDVIGWDPRGAGESTPVECVDGPAMDELTALDASPDSPQEDAALLDAATRFARACQENSGELLRHISTTDTVADLDMLRALVGDEKLNYLGYSYGTEIGAVYAATHPDRVGHLVLDSAVALDPADEVPQVAGFERAFANFTRWCAGTCGLGADAGAVSDTVVELLRGLDAEPLPVGDRELTQALAVSGLVLPLYGTERGYPALADALRAARDGDGAPLLTLADAMNDRNPDGTYGQLMMSFPAIRCASEPRRSVAEARERAAEDDAAAPVLGEFFGPDYTCVNWPVPPTPNPTDYSAPGAAPIMVIGSRLDSATPFEQAEKMADAFDSGFLVTWEGAGHGTYGGTSSCVDAAVRRYFADELPAEDLTCRP